MFFSSRQNERAKINLGAWNNNISTDCYDMFPNLTIINEALHICENVLPKTL